MRNEVKSGMRVGKLGTLEELAEFEATHPIGALDKGWARRMEKMARLSRTVLASVEKLKRVKGYFRERLDTEKGRIFDSALKDLDEVAHEFAGHSPKKHQKR